MRKRTYRGVPVKSVREEELAKAVEGRRVVVGVDVAKDICFGQFLTEDRAVVATIKWSARHEVREVIALLKRLPAAQIELGMEPSGTYQDPLRHQAEAAGLPVYRVAGKRSHDAAEVYDGVPSMHDGKAAYVVARLCLEGVGQPWVEKSETQRELRAALDLMAIHDEQVQQLMGRLEALLGRHWPELTGIMELGATTILSLLASIGGPEAVLANESAARELMVRIGGRFFVAGEKVPAILGSARDTVGMPMLPEEQRTLQAIAREALSRKAAASAQRIRVKRLSQGNEAVQRCADLIGDVTAAAMVAIGGDPRDYASATSYVKALGLNLKERSSGTHKGLLKISKRGPAEVRRYLYLATLRLLMHSGDPLFRAWYDRKVKRDGGSHKLRAVVALMRKLAAALWHVARGAPFDSRRLFDVRRLKLANPPA